MSKQDKKIIRKNTFHSKKNEVFSGNQAAYDYYKYIKAMNEHEIDGIIAAIKNAR